VAIARQLGFSGRELDVVEVAAILHDYGKIGVDDHVLKKPGKLSPEEYAHIQQHARLTHDILGRIHFARKYRNVPLIASSHHEYLDGSGYPRGLFAREIPFMSKILTVADVFEALTADRHYRKGMAPADAFRILDADVGRKFDAHVVAALKAWISENPLTPELAHVRKDAGRTE
jgi:HD-GYP domain-containing protein (c-di-GMP phosphodiesterase class II)